MAALAKLIVSAQLGRALKTVRDGDITLGVPATGKYHRPRDTLYNLYSVVDENMLLLHHECTVCVSYSYSLVMTRTKCQSLRQPLG